MNTPTECPEIGLWAQLACTWEATARKPGNVHRGRDFPGLTYVDFLLSAAAVAPVFARVPGQPVGMTIHGAIRATRGVVRTNTNLGIVLLLAPLAAVPLAEPLRPGLRRILAGLDVDDARSAYAAIRLACPGGLGEVDEQDVQGEPTRTLREVMALARDRDLVARQYTDDFAAVFEIGMPALSRSLDSENPLETAILDTQLTLLSQYPDSLIARKRGVAEATEASQRAAAVLAAPKGERAIALAALDDWLCAAGTGRNPGTTADLVTACLFAALRERTIGLPLEMTWS